MPEMDGYQAARRIRQAGQARVPIVGQMAVDAGMDAFVSKPVHRDEMARVLRRFLNCCDQPEPAAGLAGAGIRTGVGNS
ncbi:MAG TPA: hypothetical protein VME43_02850 [Bryobacteraceae bacterium]|nr:hypothetical protein [Bryobacteraceae bacterium]